MINIFRREKLDQKLDNSAKQKCHKYRHQTDDIIILKNKENFMQPAQANLMRNHTCNGSRCIPALLKNGNKKVMTTLEKRCTTGTREG